MSQGDKPTKKQHYIPQFYLKQFSSDSKNIWQYSIKDNKQYNYPVPIKSICYENYLYELRDENDSIISINAIEKLLSVYENHFAQIFKSIKNKAHNNKNVNTRCFLSINEKGFLIIFICLLILRNPEIISIAEELAIEFEFGKEADNTARNFAVASCLPLYKEIEENEKNIILKIASWFDNMTFNIGVTDKHCIITSDRPIYLYNKNGYINDSTHPQKVIVPLTYDLVLFMFPYNKSNIGNRNKLFYMNSKGVKEVNRSISSAPTSWIYSENKLTEEQIHMMLMTK